MTTLTRPFFKMRRPSCLHGDGMRSGAVDVVTLLIKLIKHTKGLKRTYIWLLPPRVFEQEGVVTCRNK